MRHVRYYCCLLLFVLTAKVSFAQIVAELVYPIVPIRDDCHFVFDDTSSIRVISKLDFQNLDRLWQTKDFCYNQISDTTFFREFEILFENSMGVYGYFNASEFAFKSGKEHILNDAITQIKPYTKVHITNAQFENNGALHQVPNFTFVIDSIIEPKEDSCFSFFDIPWQQEILLDQDSLIHLFQNNFCIDNCNNTRYWPNNESYTFVRMAASNLQKLKINSNSELSFIVKNALMTEEHLGVISRLKPNDLLVIDPMIYTKESKFYVIKGWRFRISD